MKGKKGAAGGRNDRDYLGSLQHLLSGHWVPTHCCSQTPSSFHMKLSAKSIPEIKALSGDKLTHLGLPNEAQNTFSTTTSRPDKSASRFFP